MVSGAPTPPGGWPAWEGRVPRRLRRGAPLRVIASVPAAPYVAESGEPLIRFAGHYPRLS